MSNITSDKVAILITSCDKYKDLWEPFFTLFFRYWRDCPYSIYLGTNHLKYDNKKVKTIAIGDDTNWSSGFRAVLEKIPEPYVIMMIEDFFLTKPVNTTKIEELIEYMVKRNAACLRLYPSPGPDLPCLDNPEIGEISKGNSFRLGLQAAIWNKDIFVSLLRDGESIWDVERYGTKRTEDLSEPFLSVIKNPPILYFDIGGVDRGKWIKEAIELCKKEGIEIDLNARPVQTPVDRFIRSSTVCRLSVFVRSRSRLASKFIDFVGKMYFKSKW